MAKKVITPRGELVKYARELGLETMEQTALLRLIEEAEQTSNPKQHLDNFVVVLQNTTSVTVHDNGEAAAERIAEVLDGAPTDTSDLRPPTSDLRPLDPTCLIELPNLAAIPCTGHQTRHVDLHLTKYPLARAALTRLRHHLDDNNARLSTNRHATSPATALVWLLEQYGKAAGLQE